GCFCSKKPWARSGVIAARSATNANPTRRACGTDMTVLVDGWLGASSSPSLCSLSWWERFRQRKSRKRRRGRGIGRQTPARRQRRKLAACGLAGAKPQAAYATFCFSPRVASRILTAVNLAALPPLTETMAPMKTWLRLTFVALPLLLAPAASTQVPPDKVLPTFKV